MGKGEMSEVGLMKEIQLRASENGARLFRNNSGECWIGKSQYYKEARTVTIPAGSALVFHARRFHAGLGTGSGDLIGWHPVVITKEMIGLLIGVFSNVEVKSKRGRSTEWQENFHQQSLSAGCMSAIVHSQDEYFDAVSGLYRLGSKP